MSHKKAFLIIAPNDPYFICIFAELANQLQSQYPGYTIVISPIWAIRFDSSDKLESANKLSDKMVNLLRYMKDQAGLTRKIKRLFLSFSPRMNRKSTHFKGLLDWILYGRFRPRTAEDQDFISNADNDRGSFRGIVVHDLLVDTYLRFKPSPFFDKECPFTSRIKKILVSQLNYYEHIYSSYQIVGVFTGFTSYVFYGVPARLASSKGIPLYTFGGYSGFYTEQMNPEFVSHVGDHTRYVNGDFDSKYALKSLECAEISLKNRLSGSKDTSTIYMNRFSNQSMPVQGLANQRILFLHDFFDSPHIYRWMLHSEFYDWVLDTISVAIENDFCLFIKPHPNQCELSRSVVMRLRRRFANSKLIKWIPESKSNKSIFESEPLLVISVYGSVLVEAAYMSIRGLAAGDHPAYNFSLAHTSKSLEDYHSKLINPHILPRPSSRDAVRFIATHSHSGSSPSLIRHLNTSHTELNENKHILMEERTKRYVNEQISLLVSSLRLD